MLVLTRNSVSGLIAFGRREEILKFTTIAIGEWMCSIMKANKKKILIKMVKIVDDQPRTRHLVINVNEKKRIKCGSEFIAITNRESYKNHVSLGFEGPLSINVIRGDYLNAK